MENLENETKEINIYSKLKYKLIHYLGILMNLHLIQEIITGILRIIL